MSNQKPELDYFAPENKVQFIRAGAGAGKTTTLIDSCISFVRQYKNKNGKFPKIIITTFTVKATQEIKERLVLAALKLNDEELFQYFNKKSMVQIGTIHGVLSLFIRQHAESAGLPSDLTIVNDSKIYFALKKQVKIIMEQKEELQLLLSHFSFKNLLMALLKSLQLKMEFVNLEPVSIENLQKAADDELQKLKETLKEFIDNSASYPEKWSLSVDFLKNVQRALETQNYNELLSLYENKPRKFTLSKTNPEITHDLAERIADFFGTKEACVGPMAFAQYIEINNQINQLFNQLLSYLYEFYLERQKTTGEITISDLELIALRIINCDETAMQRFSSQYDFIMVDEYQDTSPLQVKILNKLMNGRHQFIVGDPQQSIYLFRGARSEVFTNKEAELNALGYSTIFKMKNYRSHPRLMTFINDFFKLYSSSFQPMEVKSDDFVERSIPEASFISAASSEYAAVAEQILNLHTKGVSFSDITVLFKKNDDILDFAKYAHSINIPVQIQIAKGFEDKAEVVDLLTLLRFLINPHDNHNLIQLLRAPWFAITDQEIVECRQNDELKKINSFWLQLKKIQHSVFYQLKEIEECYMQNGVSEALFLFLKNTIFLNSSKYFDPTTRRESNVWKLLQTIMRAESRSDFNLSEFVNNQFTQLNSDLSSSDGEAIPLVAMNRVSLMTVHGSKGLQFKHVIIYGLNAVVREKAVPDFIFSESNRQFCLRAYLSEFEKSYPSLWATSVAQEMLVREREENDRLLYVAMTRAIDSISLIRKITKTVPQNTWLQKINWSIDQYDVNRYKLEFRDASDSIDPLAKDIAQNFKKLEPLVFDREYVQSAGVTSLLEVEQTSDRQVNDLTINQSDLAIAQQTVQIYNKAQKGTDMHRYFEALKYHNISSLTDYLDDHERVAIQWLLEQREIDLAHILDKGFVEWGFGLKIDKKLIQGQIDAWGILGSCVYILDYKTGSQKYLDKAIAQLHFYAACLKQMKLILPMHEIKLVVLYPFDKTIKTVGLNYKDINLSI